MNIEQAKTIPLSAILRKMGFEPDHQGPHEAWYYSPFRLEKAASFHIHEGRNVWYDFGSGRGGTIIDFAIEHLKLQNQPNDVSESLKWLSGFDAAPIITNQKSQLTKAAPSIKSEPALQLREVTVITHRGLTTYLQERGIDFCVAQKHLHQAKLFNRNSQKTLYALAMRNEEEGMELRNRIIKSCLGVKDITFIRGTTPKQSGVHVFEGMFDFLSVATRHKDKPFEDDAMILNSTSLLQAAMPYIKGYGYRHLYSWMDNDEAGQRATQALATFCQQEHGLKHIAMNGVYAPHKDVNAWHIQNPCL